MASNLTAQPALKAFEIKRNWFFGSFAVLAAVNALIEPAVRAITSVGWIDAAYTGFGTSKLVWAALAIGLVQLLRAEPRPIDGTDIVSSLPGLIIILVPISDAAWIGGTFIIVAGLYRGGLSRGERVGLAILLAVFIREIVMDARSIFSRAIEPLDVGAVHFVNGILGGESQRFGNLLVGSEGHSLLISQACNSLENCSLNVLIWVVGTLTFAGRWRWRHLCAGFAVVVFAWVLNVSRLSWMSLDPNWYQFWHDGIGAGLFRLALIIVTLAITAIPLAWRDD